MRNRFAGPCYRCGKRVEVGAGHFERFGGRWRVQHATCAIKHRGQPDPLRAQYQRARDERLAQSTGKAAQNARRRIRDREKAESLARMRGNDMAMKGNVSVNEYAANYYFAGEGGDYTPTKGERAMIEDAINGYLAESGSVTTLKLPALDEIAKAISGVGYPEHVGGDGFAWWWHPNYNDPANAFEHENREEDREKARRVLALFDKPACQPPTPPIDERDAFEAAYAAHAKARGIEFTAASVAALREGEEYGDRDFLNGSWSGWKCARAARS